MNNAGELEKKLMNNAHMPPKKVLFSERFNSFAENLTRRMEIFSISQNKTVKQFELRRQLIEQTEEWLVKRSI